MNMANEIEQAREAERRDMAARWHVGGRELIYQHDFRTGAITATLEDIGTRDKPKLRTRIDNSPEACERRNAKNLPF